MSIAITPDRPNQRDFLLEETQDQNIVSGEYFGTVTDNGQNLNVWYLENGNAVRTDLASPDERSMVKIQDSQSLRDTLSSLKMFENKDFFIRKMTLAPAEYYPRMYRPGFVGQILGTSPAKTARQEILFASLNQLRSLVRMLDSIFQTVHPVDANMECFGSEIRNLLILACTECEAQWRGVLNANGCVKTRLTTGDYVKLLPALRLNEFKVKLLHFPWLVNVSPFKHWSIDKPTQSINWYDNYNAIKHDRENSFSQATLGSAIQSVAAIWIMIVAQYGTSGTGEFDDLNRYFHFDQIPRWAHGEYQSSLPQKSSAVALPKNYPF